MRICHCTTTTQRETLSQELQSCGISHTLHRGNHTASIAPRDLQSHGTFNFAVSECCTAGLQILRCEVLNIYFAHPSKGIKKPRRFRRGQLSPVD